MEFYGIIVPFLIAFPSFPRAAPSFRLGPAPSVRRAMPLTAQQLFEVEDQRGKPRRQPGNSWGQKLPRWSIETLGIAWGKPIELDIVLLLLNRVRICSLQPGRLPGVDVPSSWFWSLMKIKLMLLSKSTYCSVMSQSRVWANVKVADNMF